MDLFCYLLINTILFVLVVNSSYVQEGIYDTGNVNQKLQARWMNFKLYTDKRPLSTDEVFLNSDPSEATKNAFHCGNLCINTEACCGFFFKKMDSCLLVNKFHSAIWFSTEPGYFYYEIQVFLSIFI